MLKEEVEKFSRLSGEDGQHTSICRIGAYLDGYNRGLSEDRWIPCSERLPEEEQAVLICNKSGDIRIASGSYSTEIDEWMWYLDSWRVGPVVAWRPLPKPYKSKEENE